MMLSTTKPSRSSNGLPSVEERAASVAARARPAPSLLSYQSSGLRRRCRQSFSLASTWLAGCLLLVDAQQDERGRAAPRARSPRSSRNASAVRVHEHRAAGFVWLGIVWLGIAVLRSLGAGMEADAYPNELKGCACDGGQ